jgi:DNA-nicking Smr family endonuclease
MAERDRSVPARARRRAPRPALREQVKAVARELKKKQQKRATAARTQCEAAPRFDELARGVQPLPRGAQRVAGIPAAPAVQVVARRQTRLWVEESAGAVRARASGVPARWLDELQSGRLVPRRELDLHRRSAVDARQAIAAAVSEARRAGVSCLLVVCGLGKHSGSAGPVLPDVAIECLSETLAGEVLAFASAPKKWGGKGALIVRLRPLARARAPKPSRA